MTKQNNPEPGEVMTVKDVAAYLACHVSTIHRLLERRQIPGFRVGWRWRFRRADIDQWIAERQEGPAALIGKLKNKRRRRRPR
jgi:excisionase family DNA binding protein